MSTSTLHTGHLFSLSSQGLIQLSWYSCQQVSYFTYSPTLKFSQQIVQLFQSNILNLLMVLPTATASGEAVEHPPRDLIDLFLRKTLRDLTHFVSQLKKLFIVHFIGVGVGLLTLLNGSLQHHLFLIIVRIHYSPHFSFPPLMSFCSGFLFLLELISKLKRLHFLKCDIVILLIHINAI